MERSGVQKIHIIGGGGSGKTTLAQQLSALINVPHYALDAVAYEGGAGEKRSLATREAEVARISAESAWITEGIFLWWTAPLMEQAELIIWLDLPAPIAAWRIVWRHFKKSLQGDNPHSGFKKLYKFVSHQYSHYYQPEPTRPSAPDDDGATTRAATIIALEPFETKVARCRNNRELETLLSSLQKGKANGTS